MQRRINSHNVLKGGLFTQGCSVPTDNGGEGGVMQVT